MNKLLKFTEHPILSGIIVLMIGGGSISLTGFDVFWQYIKTVFNYSIDGILFILLYEVSIWKLIIVFILLIICLLIYVKSQRNLLNEELTELEIKILKIFDQEINFCREIDIIEISRSINTGDILSVEDAVLNLTHTLNYLNRIDRSRQNTKFTLNGYGRKYILKNFR
ncbi:hypothetical protein [Arcobacter lacus]|uniref:Uncharacterized protein n=1 Tax=Arcobacter lacus TaxID=1912876 RepID=A0ABX5JKE6_9BACT|nr:hypothetical protein [Arcobacter lacus]PUE67258.1 hypothetical protein B0175_02420 [Arcobacter lacus]